MKKGKKRRRDLFESIKAVKPWGYGLLFSLLFLLIVEPILHLNHQQYKSQLKLDAVAFGNDMITNLERELNALIYLNTGVEAYIKVNYENLDSLELTRILQEVQYGNVALIRNLGIAVNTTLRYVVPLKGNENVIGIDYRDVPNQWPKVNLAIQSKKIIMDGPLNLIQGGRGLIFRVPIYVDSVYWGLMSTVIDVENLMSRAFAQNEVRGFDFAISRIQSNGQQDVFWGNKTVFQRKHKYIIKTSLYDNNWDYIIAPTMDNKDVEFRLSNLIASILSILVFLITSFYFRLRQKNNAEREQYKLLSENGSDVVWLYNLSKKQFLYVSPSISRLSGYTQEEAVQKKFEQIFALDTVSEIYRLINTKLKRFIRTGDSSSNFIYQAKFIIKNGSSIWVETSSFFQWSQDDEIELVGLTRNIDHIKRVENALKTSEKKYKEAQQIAKIGHWEHDLVNDKLKWSDEIYRIFEIDKDKFKESYEGFLAVIHPDDRQMVNQAYEISLQTREPYNINHRLKMANGTIKFVNERCVTEFDRNGVPLRSMGTVHDITESVKADEKLRQLSQAVEQSPVSVIITDVQGDIIYANPYVHEVTGYLPEELIGKNPRVLRSGNTSQKVYQELWQTITGGKTWRGQFQNRKKNGELYFESATISPVLNQDNEIKFYLAIKEDITDKLRAEKELKNREKRLDTIISTTITGISLISNEGVLSFTNPNCVNIHGYTAEEITGTNLINIVHPDDIDKAKKIFNEVAGKKQRFLSDEIRLLKKGTGEVVWINLNMTCYPKLDEKEEDRILLMFQDISKRLKLEQELKKLNQDKDRFMSILAHDLRSPFNGLLGLFSIMIEDLKKLKLDELEDMLIEMNKSATNIFNLLEDLLIWSKSQSGSLVSIPEWINLEQICNEVLEILMPSAQNKGIQLSVNCGGDYTVFVDENMIRMVIRNLISNAIKFTYREGKIVVNVIDEQSHFRLSVQDNGVGMSSRKTAKLWNEAEPFTSNGTEGEGGTGLGLLLCREMVTRFGGKIWVESEEGKGSTFFFTVPKSEKNEIE